MTPHEVAVTRSASHRSKPRRQTVVARAMQPIALALMLLALAACGGSGGDGAPPPPAEPPPSGSATVGGAAQTGTITVRSAQGVQVVVPPGAAAAPVTVRIAADSTGAPPLPDGLRPLGSIFAITPHGARFAVPVTVRVPAPAVTPAANERLMLAKADPNGRWELIDTGPPVDGHLVAQVQSFSYFLPVIVVYQATALEPLRLLSPIDVECVTPDCRNLPPEGSTIRVTVRTAGTALPLVCDGRMAHIEVRILWPHRSNRVALPISGGTAETRVAFEPNPSPSINPARGDGIGIVPDIVCSTSSGVTVIRGGVFASVWFAHFNWPQSTNPQPRVVSLTLPDVVAGQSAEVQAVTYGGAHRRPFVLNRDTTATLTGPGPGNQATIEWQRSDDGGGSWRTVATSFQSDAERRPTVFPEDWAYWRSRHRFDVDARATGEIRFRARACIEMQVAEGATGTRTEPRCDTSATATARVLQQATAPGFTTLPRSQLVLNGETASFNAVADGLPAPALQWQTRPANSVGVWTDVPGATNPGFTTRLLTLADNGTQYRVVATNTGGSNASPPVTVSVSDTAVAPVITAEPSSIRALRGGDATFAVAVRGTEPLSYEWRLDGNVVPAQNGPQLNLQSVQANRTVQVRVSNAAGTVTSRSVALEVFEREIPIAPPVIDRDPVATGGLEGATVSLAVQARGGTLSYRWQRNGVDLPSAPDAPVLVLSSLTTAAEGDYRVVVSNASGSVTSAAAALTVRPASGPRSAPAIDVQPTGLTLDAGQTATFAVGVSGSGPLAFQWHRDGVPIGGATSAVLTLGAITSADAANYTVRISNSEGNVTSAAAGLVVVPAPGAPRYVTQQFALEALVGDSPRIQMLAIGTPAPRCLWLRNGVPIPNATDCTGLDLGNVQLVDSGAVFTAIAYSAGGAAVGGPAVLTVRTGVAPTVTQQPTDQVAAVVPPGTTRTARFSAAYDGVPQPQPQWRINGTLLGPATIGSFDDGTCQLAYDIFGIQLILSQIGPGCDGATVQGVGTNRIGSVSTNVVRLTFASNPPAPVVTTQPQNVTVTAGQPATFTAAVANAPFLQWESDRLPVVGATAPSYTIGTTTLADNGAVVRLLACTQPGPSGLCVYTDFATLRVNPVVNPAPTITSFTSNGPRPEGQTATVTVAATGTNLTYQWLLTYDFGATARTIPGATLARYTTPVLTQGYNNAGLQVRVCSGPQPTGSGADPSCTFSSLEAPLAQTFEIGANGACFGGPSGWCYRGPTPQGGDLTGLVLPDSMQSPDAPVVAVGYGTVLESNDFGANWTMRFPTPRLDFRSLARRPNGSLLAAPVAANAGQGVSAGVYISSDGGANWGSALTVSAPNTVNDIAFVDNGVGVAVGTGLWRSTDGGVNWTPVATSAYTPPETLLRVTARGNTVLAVGDAGNILRSVNGGATWNRVRPGNGERMVDVSFNGSGRAVAIAENVTRIWISTDGGANWNDANRLPFANARAGAIDLNDRIVVLNSQSQVITSNDLGQTWTPLAGTVRGVDSWRLALSDFGGGEAMAVGRWGAILRSGSNFDFYATGGGSEEARITALESYDGAMLIVRENLIGRSGDGGLTWAGFAQQAQALSMISPDQAFATLTAFGSARLFRTINGGANWTEAYEGPGDQITGLSMINTGVGMLIGRRGGQPRVFRTVSGGFWEPVPGLDPNFEPLSVRAMNPGPFTDPLTAVVLVGSSDGRILRTANGGISWLTLNPGIGGAIRHIARIDVSTAILAADDGLWRSTDAGQNWTRVYDSTAFGSMTAVAANPGGSRCVAVGVVGVLIGSGCTAFGTAVDLPFAGVLEAAAWPTSNNVLVGGAGGTLLLNRNDGVPAAPPPPPVGAFSRASRGAATSVAPTSANPPSRRIVLPRAVSEKLRATAPAGLRATPLRPAPATQKSPQPSPLPAAPALRIGSERKHVLPFIDADMNRAPSAPGRTR